jgi:hypothetical protein
MQKTDIAQNQLKGMQSVRTTFRLSGQGEKIFEELVKGMKITMKEWFDAMLHIVRTLELTHTLVESAAARAKNPASGIRKTWVISREALSSIKSIADENKVSRDALVESLIFLMDDILRQARQKRPENLKKALELVRDFQGKADDVHSQLLDLLGDEDPVSRFYDAVSIADIVAQDIEKALDQAVAAEPNNS